MKKILFAFILIVAILILNSCGISNAYIFNHNQNATEVHLKENNFKVIEQVSGSSEASYICAIGGINKKKLYKNAYAAMLTNANLVNSSKAIINVTTEEHFSGFAPIYVKRTITVSAQVIEFTR